MPELEINYLLFTVYCYHKSYMHVYKLNPWNTQTDYVMSFATNRHTVQYANCTRTFLFKLLTIKFIFTVYSVHCTLTSGFVWGMYSEFVVSNDEIWYKKVLLHRIEQLSTMMHTNNSMCLQQSMLILAAEFLHLGGNKEQQKSMVVFSVLLEGWCSFGICAGKMDVCMV
jgi:hypothetical protein